VENDTLAYHFRYQDRLTKALALLGRLGRLEADYKSRVQAIGRLISALNGSPNCNTCGN